MTRVSTLCLMVTMGCASVEPGPPRAAWAVFPNEEMIGEQGLTLPEDPPYAGTPAPLERFAMRRGFSPVQTAVVRPDVALDPTSLPAWDGPLTEGSVQLWDLTDGTPIPCFAELDAWPNPVGPAPLLVRPGQPAPVGHRVGLVVRQTVRTADGQPLAVAPWLQAVLDGAPDPGLADVADRYVDLVDRFAALGVDDAAIVSAWTVDDGTRPLRAVVDAVGVPAAYSVTVEDVDDGAVLPARTWRRLTGTFTTDSWLVDDTTFAFDADGLPIAQGTAQAHLYVHVPDSVRDAAPGTVPVWIFGHGIFSSPERYLGDPEDPSGVVEVADRAGAIVLATTWRGLTTSDFGVPVTVAQDFWRLPEITDKLVQGVANTVGLARLALEGDLLDDPALDGLPDPSQVFYYGISLGGIEGAVFLANAPAGVEQGVLHVGGSTWSTMLERSQNWTLFEQLIVSSGLDDPGDRQLDYALSQLLWDPADPALYADDLAGRDALWQVALGDDQVPNLTTYTLMRGVGAPLIEPEVAAPWGITTHAADVHGPAFTQFDPQQGDDEGDNRPAEDTTSHETPRLWEPVKLQTLRFLDPSDPGVIVDYCGGPCTQDAVDALP